MNTTIFVWLVYAIWLTIIAYLTVSAIGVKQETRGHLLQGFGLMFAIIAAFLLPCLPMFRFLNVASANPVVDSLGIILCVTGMAVLVWARKRLGRNWSQTVSIKKDHELVTSGPYRFIRHPMYAGGLIACIGSAIVCGGAWILLFVILGVIFLHRVGWEQKIDSWHNNFRTNTLNTRSGQRH